MTDNGSDTELLDFLYADHERVASFLAQIDGQGALRATEETGTKSKSEKAKSGINLGMAALGGEGTTEWQKDIRRTFDPLWINSRRLIQHFSSKSSEAAVGVGQTRILEGRLLAYDFSSLTSMMKSPAMDSMIASGISDEKFESRSAKVKNEAKNKEAAILRELLQGLGLGIGFVLVTDHGHFWFSVKKDYLSLYDLDIPLKFPTHISGIWKVLGVIDALPQDQVDGMQDVIAKNIDGLIPGMVVHMYELIRALAVMFGRPITAHGLSPLVVFREITS